MCEEIDAHTANRHGHKGGVTHYDNSYTSNYNEELVCGVIKSEILHRHLGGGVE